MYFKLHIKTNPKDDQCDSVFKLKSSFYKIWWDLNRLAPSSNIQVLVIMVDLTRLSSNLANLNLPKYSMKNFTKLLKRIVNNFSMENETLNIQI